MNKNPNDQSSSCSPLHQQTICRPYCSLGAGRLTSFLWKTGDANSGWRYRFNLFRLGAKGGRVSQLFLPSDLMHFVKLVQVMASVIADDGCLSAVERGVLRRLASDLDEMLNGAKKPAANPRATSPLKSEQPHSTNKDHLHGNETDS